MEDLLCVEIPNPVVVVVFVVAVISICYALGG